ncbi:MAG: hypothetical protein JNL04_02905 [Rhodospirillaceae bacterium]|nr:hypothetical protein [Rhodospirillaceae bacterium]
MAHSGMDRKAILDSDVRASWRWLGHAGYTELVALHPEYRPGKEHYEHNKSHDAFPRTAYVRSEEEVVAFARKHHGSRMVCYGINERPKAYLNERGYPRAAREEEIPSTKSFFIDIDIKAKQPSQAHAQATEKFLDEADSFFQDLSLQKPVHAFTGRGYHLLFAYPSIRVADCPDVAERQRKFANDFRDSYHKDLADLEAEIDATHDLRRMAKIYGTAKPHVGVVSRFYGAERVEDEQLRIHLLGMALPERPLSLRRVGDGSHGSSIDAVAMKTPRLVETMIAADPSLRALYEGEGKHAGDSSRSGYDYVLIRELRARGFDSIEGMIATLWYRPEGAVQKSGKGLDYVLRTIAKAIAS